MANNISSESGKILPFAANIRRVVKQIDGAPFWVGKGIPAMNYLILIDGTSAVIVLGGTLLATFLRSGLRGSMATLRCLLSIVRPGFDAARARAEIAIQIQDIHRDGFFRAEPRHFGDEEFDDVADTLIERRSIHGLLAKHRAHREARQTHSRAVVNTLYQAAETAPVFGLAGTLLALSQLPVAGAEVGAISGSLSTAVVTTFYGLMTGHLIFAPLAHFVQRRADAEEVERQILVDWLAGELEKDRNRKSGARAPVAA